MTDLIKLLEDICNMVESCPLVVDALGEPGCVTPYLDQATASTNSLSTSVYRQPNGNILVAWQASTIVEGDLSGWEHRVEMYVRARKGYSPLNLLNALIDGVPEGDTLRWRYLCVNEDMDPMQVEEIVRLTDEEGIDYYVLRALFREKSDEPYTE